MTNLTINDIHRVAIVGSGTLGLRVGLQCALSGFDTTIYDVHAAALEQGKQTQQRILKGLVKHEQLAEEEATAATKRIIWTTDPAEAAQEADFVNESVTEDPELKKKVWADFGPRCPERAVLTTNTSYLLPSMFAQESGRPERFCAFHFHDVFTANVVDIMPHPGTEAWIVDFLQELGVKLKQTPVVLQRESPGYVFNAMLMALLGAAGALVTYDVTTIQDVDRSWMGNFKMDRGPFGIMDTVGLDTAWHIVKARKDEKSQRFARLLHTYVEQGKLGVKTGEGFYTYPNPAFKQEGFVQA
ncbi:MAG: 3-hydroxyacyl-CoA dehydrogenase NAD-binding domain-containing protein [Tunicatimonas sp.]